MKNRSIRIVAIILLMALMTPVTTSCYLNRRIEASEMGVRTNRGRIEEVVGPGQYSGGIWRKIYEADVSAKTTTWEDPDVWTADKQSVRFSVGITYARKSDPEALSAMWTRYNAEAQYDDALERLVLIKVPRVVKQVTTSMTLDQMLGIAEGGNREMMASEMFVLLQAELDECYIQLLDIGVNDIGVDPTYAAKMNEKATAQINVELSQNQTRLLNEQLVQEQAQTKIELEKATRANKVAEEQAKVYATSPEAMELERLRILISGLKDTDKVYFIPEGQDITLYLASTEQTAQDRLATPANQE